jgi:hypothetical protein
MKIHDYLSVPIGTRLRWWKGTVQERRWWAGREHVTWLIRQCAPKGRLP